MSQVYLSLAMSDGTVAIMGFGTVNLRAPKAGETPKVAVMSPWGELLPAVIERREVTDEEVFAECAKIVWDSGAHVVSWRQLDGEPDLNDEYRNAWTDTGKAIDYDMPRARAMHRDKLRRERAPLLTVLDREQSLALRAKDDSAFDAVEARKQALRDAPADPRIDAASSIEELRAVTLPTGR